MTNNPFAPPTAPLDIPAEPSTETYPFYVVSPMKLFLLNMASFNLFIIFWFYQHWSAIKSRLKLPIWPIPRALLGLFFVNALFRHFKSATEDGTQPEEQDASKSFPFEDYGSGLVAALVIFLFLRKYSPADVSTAYISSVLYLLLIPGITALICSVQKAVNVLCLDPKGASNKKLNLKQWGLVVLGALFWFLTILDILGFFDEYYYPYEGYPTPMF